MRKQPKLRLINYPFKSDEFVTQWDRWKMYKKQEHRFGYKSEISEQAGLDRLAKISDNNEEKAIDIIEFCIAQTWSGLYPINNNNYGKQTTSGVQSPGNQQTVGAIELLNEIKRKRGIQ